jgi:hypothetical protein
MPTIILKLTPELLTNPVADLRYAVPDLLVERSGDVIADDSYDYLDGTDEMLIFLQVTDVTRASQIILETLATEQILGNDLRPGCVVAVERDGRHEVIYPADFQGEFRVA